MEVYFVLGLFVLLFALPLARYYMVDTKGRILSGKVTAIKTENSIVEYEVDGNNTVKYFSNLMHLTVGDNVSYKQNKKGEVQLCNTSFKVLTINSLKHYMGYATIVMIAYSALVTMFGMV